MLLRSRCGDNCRCEKPHAHHRPRPRSLQRTPVHSGLEQEQSAWSSHRTASSSGSSVVTYQLSSTELSSLAGFSPPDSSTPIRAGVSRRRTVEDRRGDTSLSSGDRSIVYAGSSSAARESSTILQRQGILKSSDATELQSVKQVRFDGVQNGSVQHWGGRYSDDSDAEEGTQDGGFGHSHDGRVSNGVLKSGGHSGGLLAADSATLTTTTTTTTTRTLTTEDVPNGDTMMGDIYSDSEDEGMAGPRARGGRRSGIPRRAVYVVGAQNAAAAAAAPPLPGADRRYHYQGVQQAGAWGAPTGVRNEPAAQFGGAQQEWSPLWRALWGLLLGVGKTVYTAAASVIFWDTWLLTRMTQQSRKRLAMALLLLTVLPLLAWVLWKEWEGEAGTPLTMVSPAVSSVGSSLYETVSKVPGMLGGAVASLNLSLPWLTSRSGDQPAAVQSAADVGPGLAASLSQLSDEQLDALAQKMSDRLALTIPIPPARDHHCDEQSEARMNRLEQELQAHRTTVEQLVQRLGDQEDCCKNAAALLAGLDTTIIAKVLEVLNDSSSAAPRSVLLRTFLEEVDRREGNLAASLKDGFGARFEELRRGFQAELALATQSASQAQQTAREAKKVVQEAIEEARLSPPTVVSTTTPEISSSTDEVTRIVKEMLAKYDADKTGMPDYALETAGGSVVNTRCTETYVAGAPKYYWYGLPLWTFVRTAREAILPGMQPGQCWPFRGSQGQLVIKLSQPIRVTAFTVEHISRSVAIGESISSAPREFEIWGLESENDSPGRRLGSYTYKLDGDPLQQFIVEDPEPAIYGFIEMKILSNHGNLDYTCLYRLRVHGVPT